MNSPCFLRTSAMFPSVPTYSVTPIAGSSFQNYPARTRTLSSPVFLHSLAESAFEPPPVPAPALQNLVVTPTPQTLEQRSSRLIQQPKPTYPTFPCLRPCPAITHDYPFSPRYQSAFNAAQLALCRTLELSADNSDARMLRHTLRSSSRHSNYAHTHSRTGQLSN